MLDNFSGATRVHFIVGDPIAQVKSPFGVTQAFEQAGRDAICVPAHVPTADLAAWLYGVSKSRNVDGVIVDTAIQRGLPNLWWQESNILWIYPSPAHWWFMEIEHRAKP